MIKRYFFILIAVAFTCQLLANYPSGTYQIRFEGDNTNNGTINFDIDEGTWSLSTPGRTGTFESTQTKGVYILKYDGEYIGNMTFNNDGTFAVSLKILMYGEYKNYQFTLSPVNGSVYNPLQNNLIDTLLSQ